MPGTFKLVEPLAKLGVEKPFGVNESGVHIFECLRLLCGTVDLVDKASGEVLKLRHCHLSLSNRRLKKNTLKEVANSAFDEEIELSDIGDLLGKIQGRNRNFWEQVKSEVCLALAARSRQSYLASFLSIYRLHEMISVALPLFYAGAEHDFRKALDFLKALPSNPRDGDLAIMKKFVEVVARSGGYDALLIDIPFSHGSARWDAEYCRQVDSYVVKAEKLQNQGVLVDDATKLINVPFSTFPSFLVTYRNRLFHNALSSDNFDIDSLGGADMVCRPLIDPSLNWVTLLLCVVIKQNLSRYLVPQLALA